MKVSNAYVFFEKNMKCHIKKFAYNNKISAKDILAIYLLIQLLCDFSSFLRISKYYIKCKKMKNYVHFRV